MTRRELIRLGGAAGATFLFARRTMNAEVTLVPARAAVDHLLLGVSDLDRGIARVEEKTGVRAAIGGSHPGRGTRNALLSLGERQYLEIIAPDPAQPPSVQRADLLALSEPRLIGWAAAATSIEELAKRGRDSGQRGLLGLLFIGPRDGSRARPDGKTLKWKTLGVVTELGAAGLDPMPFFIEWSADSLHPSQDSPRGCELLSFEIEHPDPAAVAGALKQLGIDATARHAARAGFVAMINTPRGKAELR